MREHAKADPMIEVEGGAAQRRVPFAERVTCSVDDAILASGIGRSTLYKLMRSGVLESVKRGDRRLVRVQSLLKLLTADTAAGAAA